MAKYDVTMSCGHVQTVQLFGKMEDRENKIAWLENHGVCTECQKAEKERKHAEATAKAAEKAIADNLPELTGTEKQVNWALTIRAKMLAEVDKKIADNKDRMDAEKLATAELQAKAIKKVVANKFTTAKFWIDNRDSILQQVIKNNNLAEEIKAEIANLQAAETAEVIAEDDGSNDDDYDEDEIVTVDNTDNDNDDDDELADTPIETAEVQEEVKIEGIKVTCKAFKTHYCKEIRGTRKIEHFNASKILKATAGCFATEQHAILSAKFFMDSLKQGSALFDPYADVEKIEIRFEGENINYVVNANTRLAATRKINALLKTVDNATKFEVNKLYYTFDEDLNQKEYFVMRKFKGYIWLAENFGNFNQKRYRVWIGGFDADTYEYVNISKDVKLTSFNVYVEENDNANTDNAGEESTEVENVTDDENIAEDDELVDPPIETAEVQEEVKMKKVRMVDQPHYMGIVSKGVAREELTFPNFKAAYRAFKAIENADNLVSVIIGHDDGETYTSAYYKNVYDNEECITAKTGKKDPVNTEYYAEIESVIAEVNAEVENVTSDEEVTADIEEVSVKIKELEKKLASLKSFTPNTDEYMAACIETIKNCYARIAQAEDKLWQFKLEKESYDRDVAALENEIVNRKLIDATDEIVMSDAVDASVAAMEELNAANFTTANLLDAVNAQAKNAVENIPVTFELQHFAEDADIAEGVATIDTSISGTVIAPADEDDVKTQAYLAEIADIDAQIAALQAKRDEKETELINHLEGVTAWAYNEIKAAVKDRDADLPLVLITPIGSQTKINKDNVSELYFDYFNDGAIKISQYTHQLVIYSTAKQFKAVVHDLVEAIKRGDETFTFPADIPPIAEVADSDAEIAKQIWF